jgi:hypothetical protein
MIKYNNDIMVVFSELLKALGGDRPHCRPYLPLNKTNLNTNNVILSTNYVVIEHNVKIEMEVQEPFFHRWITELWV